MDDIHARAKKVAHEICAEFTAYAEDDTATLDYNFENVVWIVEQALKAERALDEIQPNGYISS